MLVDWAFLFCVGVSREMLRRLERRYLVTLYCFKGRRRGKGAVSYKIWRIEDMGAGIADACILPKQRALLPSKRGPHLDVDGAAGRGAVQRAVKRLQD